MSKMGALERFEFNSMEEYYKLYIEHIKIISDTIDFNKFEKIIQVLLNAYENNKKIIFIGNGGSAATASHFCEDLSEIGRKLDSKIFRSLSLTDNCSYITAIGNDYGYEHIFVKQMESCLSEGDVLISISASGNSQNILNAIEYCKTKSCKTISLLGFDGGKAAESSDLSLVVKTEKGEYGPVEDMHMLFVHIITSYLYLKMKKD